MIALVTGAASSGKSAFAEALACALPGPHTYLATMRHGDAETEARIERHRRQRAGKGFSTLEAEQMVQGEGAGMRTASSAERASGADAAPLCHPGRSAKRGVEGSPHRRCGFIQSERSERQRKHGTILLEDLGNLVANEWDLPLDELFACGNVVVVGNEVGSDGACYDDFTRAYIERLGALACRIAARADVVVEVVAGVPNVVKGELPWAF